METVREDSDIDYDYFDDDDDDDDGDDKAFQTTIPSVSIPSQPRPSTVERMSIDPMAAKKKYSNPNQPLPRSIPSQPRPSNKRPIVVETVREDSDIDYDYFDDDDDDDDGDDKAFQTMIPSVSIPSQPRPSTMERMAFDPMATPLPRSIPSQPRPSTVERMSFDPMATKKKYSKPRQPPSRGNTTTMVEVARYNLPSFQTTTTTLVVAKGSVLSFQGSVIVNAANVGCLSGGGVDGAISRAGGRNLQHDRYQLPILAHNPDIRCHEGRAVLTGPNDYGPLLPLYIIHAVGPNFQKAPQVTGLERLRSAYQSALDLACQHRLETVGFSLLSAGVFRGPLSLSELFLPSVEAIRDWAAEASTPSNNTSGSVCTSGVKEIHLCAFTEQECFELQQVCDRILLLPPATAVFSQDEPLSSRRGIISSSVPPQLLFSTPPPGVVSIQTDTRKRTDAKPEVSMILETKLQEEPSTTTLLPFAVEAQESESIPPPIATTTLIESFLVLLGGISEKLRRNKDTPILLLDVLLEVWDVLQFVWKLLQFVWKLFQGTISVLIYVVSNIYNQSSILVETIQDRWDRFLQDYKGIEASDYIDRNDFIEHVRYESIPIYE